MLDRTASREEVSGFKTASTEVVSRQLAPWLFAPLARAFLAADATLHAAVGDVDAGEFVAQLLGPALDRLLGNGGNGGSDQKI